MELCYELMTSVDARSVNVEYVSNVFKLVVDARRRDALSLNAP
jgi:hypothetical protein